MNFFKNLRWEMRLVLALVFLDIAIAGGIFGYAKIFRQGADVPSSVLQFQESDSENLAGVFSALVRDVSNWGTYTNEDFGFEIQYPQDWEIIEKEEVNEEYGVKKRYAFFSENTGISLDIFVVDNEELSELFYALLGTEIGEALDRGSVTYLIQEHFTASGVTGVNYYTDHSESTASFPPIKGEAMVKKGDNIFSFALLGRRGEDKDIFTQFFQQILSTFRFTR